MKFHIMLYPSFIDTAIKLSSPQLRRWVLLWVLQFYLFIFLLNLVSFLFLSIYLNIALKKKRDIIIFPMNYQLYITSHMNNHFVIKILISSVKVVKSVNSTCK
jgi:hypothetical protein